MANDPQITIPTSTLGLIEIAANKYLPEGFVMIRDSEGTSFLNLATGVKVLIPPYSFELELPREYKWRGPETGESTALKTQPEANE